MMMLRFLPAVVVVAEKVTGSRRQNSTSTCRLVVAPGLLGRDDILSYVGGSHCFALLFHGAKSRWHHLSNSLNEIRWSRIRPFLERRVDSGYTSSYRCLLFCVRVMEYLLPEPCSTVLSSAACVGSWKRRSF